MTTLLSALTNPLCIALVAGLTATAAAQTDLTWDPGTTDAGASGSVYNHPNTNAGEYQFRIATQDSTSGGWRTALRVTAGEANLYIRQGSAPTTTSFFKKSERAGSDGFVLKPSEFSAGQEWFILVDASAGAQWSLVSGEIFVQDLGSLAFTDTNANNAYDIGELTGSSGSGPVAIGAEGTRFFKATSPPGTPAWSLWLNGVAKDIAVRKTQAPFPDQADRIQNGRLLMVPPYLTGGTDTVFISVDGVPGESINLDSRIQPVTDVAFGSTQAGVAISGAPFKIFRVTVPPEQLGWDVNVTPTAGDPNVAVRQGNAAGEFDNQAQSAVAGSTVDAVTLVPAGLTDGTWFITVWSGGAATFTLRNGSPTVTPIAFADAEVNDQPTRAGWRYYALSDIPSQLAKLGWQLELTNHVPGTEIAIRRNALPGRWSGRNAGSHFSVSYVDFSSTTGLLNRPGHQADVWYVGVYRPEGPLGAFTLTTREIPAPPVAFDGGTTVQANQLFNEWRWFRIDVPTAAALKGWELKFTSVTSGKPTVVVRRGLLPDGVFNAGWHQVGPSGFTTWPQGNMVAQIDDFTGYRGDPSGQPFLYRRLNISMGRPLEPGTYYVGVTGYDGPDPLSYTLESRGVGTGFGIPITDLGNATTLSNTPVNALAARDPRFFHVTVPPGMTSWETVVDVTAGQMVLWARKNTIPSPDSNSGIDSFSGRQVQKSGDERLVVLPRDGQDFIDPGDYYLAVISEGTDPLGSANIGTGTATATLQNNGPLAVTHMGTATAGGLSLPISLEAGQIKAYRVFAPAGIISLEARLDSKTGFPTVAMKQGARLPASFENRGYASELGQSGAVTNSTLVTINNAPADEYHIVLQAGYDAALQSYVPATADLVVTARTPPNVAFDTGSSVVTNQPSNAWRFFRVDVPAGPLGWEFRLTNVTGRPWMVVRRDLLPEFLGGTPFWDAYGSPTWPSGNQTLQFSDFTGVTFEPDVTDASARSMTLAMGRPLEPGTYYVGVSSPYEDPLSYTLESRGIGNGLALPVTPLAFAGGAAAVPSKPARRATFYKVTVPASTPSWEVTLDPTLGDMTMWIRHGTVPNPTEFHVEAYGGVRVRKPGQERFVVLPKPGQDFITAGDYYIAAVSEGIPGPNPNLIGSGDSAGTLTSVGTLGVTNLGTVTEAGPNPAVNLLGAQVKAYQITVPAGASSLDVELETLTGNPLLTAVPGTRLPSSTGSGTFWNFGESPTHTTNEFHVVNPVAGPWSLLIRGGPINSGAEYPAATGTLHLSVAAGPQPLAFNGGTASVTNQPLDTWRFFQVEVPAGAAIKGWDLRLVNVTSGTPKLVVRRGQLPESLFGSGLPENLSSWPVGASRASFYDPSHRSREPDNRFVNGQFLVSAMGHPLEPGTYFVGVTNELTFDPALLSYTIESRGIGAGQAITITDLALNGSQPVPSTPARHVAYFKTTVPASTPSWEVTLDPTLGDLCWAARIGFLPDNDAIPGSGFGAPAILSGSGRFQSKPGPERYVLLPNPGDQFLVPGDYYLAAVSEGVNAGVPSSDTIGTGNAAGTIASKAPLPVTNLGTVTLAGTSQNVALAAGQYRAFQMTVPAGASILEIRLDNRVGNPGVAMRAGTNLVETLQYASEGGLPLEAGSDSLITVFNPAAGVFSLRVANQPSFDPPEPAQADLVVRLLESQRLNFSSTENGNGFSHTDTRSLVNTQRQFYSVPVPATVGGAEILGWYVSAPTSQGQVRLRVYESSNFAGGPVIDSFNGKSLVIVPPFFQPSKTWFLEVEGVGATTYTVTSQPIVLQHAPYTMPTIPGQTFADTGQGLGGDQGIDLGNDSWHFYAFDVPAGNGGLLRAELRALNGNPDLFLRRGGIPTPHHQSSFIWPFGFSLVDRQALGTTTEYANWTPLTRTETELAAGRWYAAIRASSNTNARYRLLLSTGAVQTLALNGGNLANQNLAPRDARYYRFTVPLDAPLEWKLTLSEQQGDVRAYIRDVVPPGSEVTLDNTFQDLRDWGDDAKNQGPYPILDTPGTYTLTTPPLRPGSTYYVGVEAVDTAVFSLGSTTAGGTLGTLQVLDFLGGQIDTDLAVGARARWRVPVPVDVVRWKHKATHHFGVRILIEQGTIPIESSSHYSSSGADTVLSRLLDGWPWVAGKDYYLLVANDSGVPQHFTLTMDGRDVETDDEDGDGIADAWEAQYFGGSGFNPSGDNDGDGLPNDVEYGLGLNPTSGDTGDLPAADFVGSGGTRHLALDIPLPPDIPPQVRLEVFASDTLGGPGTSIAVRPPEGAWSGAVTQIPGGVRIADPQPFDTATRRFLWLSVTLVPETP